MLFLKRMAFWAYGIALVGLVFVVGCQSPVQPDPKAESAEIKISKKELEMYGKTLSIPLSLSAIESALGKSDRVIVVANEIHVWDDKGIAVFVPKGEQSINQVTLFVDKSDQEFCPKNLFSDSVAFNSQVIFPDATLETLTNAGFDTKNPELGSFWYTKRTMEVNVEWEEKKPVVIKFWWK